MEFDLDNVEPPKVHITSVHLIGDGAWRVQELARRNDVSEKMAMLEIFLVGMKQLGITSTRTKLSDITSSRR